MTDGLKVLIADDEPFYHGWLVDFLETLGLLVDFAENIEIAITKLSDEKYRFMIVDLSIPLNDKFMGTVRAEEAAFIEFPGLYIAHFARNNGYRGRQIIVYSVHVSKTIQEFVDRIRCTYIPKGRPRLLKDEIKEVLKFDPEAAPDR